MARAKATTANTTTESPQDVTKALSPMDTPGRFKLGAIGTNGLNNFNGVTIEEFHRDLQWPKAAETFKKMQYSTPVNACLSLYDNLISKVNWRVVPPQEATEEEKQQAKFIEECLHDMDVPFRQVIKDALTSNTFGFAVMEKVFRRRNAGTGSMYNDNKIALKKLAIRNQETIEKFIFDAEGNEILGVKQNISGYQSGRYDFRKELEVVIPRNKYWHVTTGRGRGDPFGKSPLRDVYIAWRFLEVIAEMEASGAARDLQGVPIMRVPAQLLSEDASPNQKIILENLKNILRNLQANSQSGVMLPSAVEESSKTPLFDLSLLSTEGGKRNFDLDKIKTYYQNQIYTGLSADVLILGQGSSGGSYNLATIKNTITGAAVESMMDTLVETFNRDVIRHLYVLNGMDPARACSLDYENLHTTDLESVSRYVQRCMSVGAMEKDRATLNFVRSTVGLDPLPEDTPVPDYILQESSSRAGDGYKTAGEGTSTDPTNVGTNDNNLENVG